MTSGVLDASAVLALLQEEPGSDVVEEFLPAAVISSVNYAEVVGKLFDANLSAKEVQQILAFLSIPVVEFTETFALRVGALKKNTSHLGLSLGDRACLALAESLGVPAVTADRIWMKANVGVEVVVVR